MSERVEKYRAAIGGSDFETLGALRHPEYQCYYPQSGERFLSHDAWVEAHVDYASRFAEEDLAGSSVKGGEIRAEVTRTVSPTFLLPTPIVQVSDTGDLVVMEGKGTWPDGKVYNWVRIVEYRDHLVWRETEYFAEPFEPMEWRAPFVVIDPPD
ncbi:MAG: hypothetical protein ACR2OI_04930 [Acidimicrobiia bacterium]